MIPASRSATHWIARRFVLITALACLAGYVYVYRSGRAGVPIRSDAFSYYVYLPSWLLHHDSTLQRVADDCCGGEFPAWTAIIRWPGTHHWVNAHPIGEAILIAPFFIAAHLLTRWTNLSPDGFSLYYQHAAGLSGLAAVVIGIWFLQRLLRRHVSDGVTLATLATLLTGTSLYHYATFDSAWSHAFSFALFSALLERLDSWQRDPDARGLAIGVLSGLIALVRHPNVMFPLIFVIAIAIRSWQRRETGFRGGRLAITTLAATAIFLVPQLALYYSATGKWLISSYGDLGFMFSSPHVAGVLVSPQKGLFFWAPVLVLALPGFFLTPQGLRDWRWPLAIFLLADTYIIASWWDWQFGGSFGHRGFVDVYPLLSLGLASLYARVSSAGGLVRGGCVAIAIGLCCVSTFQMLQYWHGVLPMSDVTWAQYRALFLRPW